MRINAGRIILVIALLGSIALAVLFIWVNFVQ